MHDSANCEQRAERYGHAEGESTAEWLRSPIRFMLENRLQELRRPWAGPTATFDFPIFQDLAAEGATDYYARIFAFSRQQREQLMLEQVTNATGEGMFLSIVTDRQGGFDEADLALLDRAGRRFAATAKVTLRLHATHNLLDAFMGRDAASRVLVGSVRRGQGETINAVIWYSDLRGSASMTEHLPSPVFLELLNRYFEATAGAVLDHGGEVLRFVGDVVLGVFPISHDAGPALATQRALAAARDAAGRVAAANADDSLPRPIRYGVGLTLGEVLYGNIGVPSRVEFSVIGMAANEAARLEELTKSTGRCVSLSADLAAHIDEPLIDLGAFTLRGRDQPMRVYTLP